MFGRRNGPKRKFTRLRAIYDEPTENTLGSSNDGQQVNVPPPSTAQSQSPCTSTDGTSHSLNSEATGIGNGVFKKRCPKKRFSRLRVPDDDPIDHPSLSSNDGQSASNESPSTACEKTLELKKPTSKHEVQRQVENNKPLRKRRCSRLRATSEEPPEKKRSSNKDGEVSNLPSLVSHQPSPSSSDSQVSKTPSKTRAPSRNHEDPNQTIKVSFRSATQMPPKVNKWEKKIVCQYFGYLFKQESYNLLIMRNLGTHLVNYLLFTCVIRPLNERMYKLLDGKPTLDVENGSVASQAEAIGIPSFEKVEQDFIKNCMSLFNSTNYGTKAGNTEYKIPKGLTKYANQIVDFLNFAAPPKLELKLMFPNTLNIDASRLQTNCNEYFKRKTKGLVKWLVEQNTKVKMRNWCYGYIADVLLREKFVLTEKDGKTKAVLKQHRFTNKVFQEPFTETVKVADYKEQSSELDRWLFFHRLVYLISPDYRTECEKRLKWVPLCSRSKLPHVDFNNTELIRFFPSKLNNIMNALDNQEDPFSIFYFPKFKSPLRRYYPCGGQKKGKKQKFSNMSPEERAKVLDERKGTKRHKRPLRTKQLTLWLKIQNVYKELNVKVPIKRGGNQNGLKIPIFELKQDPEILDEKGQKVPKDNSFKALDAWLYVFPSLDVVLKSNAYNRFKIFPHISTNGVDMSVYLFNENKVTTKTKPSELSTSFVTNKRLMGVDPGVHSLATTVYSHCLEQDSNSTRLKFQTPKGKTPFSTQMPARELFHKYYVECGPLHTFQQKHNKTVKQRLMDIGKPENQRKRKYGKWVQSVVESTNDPNSPEIWFAKYPNNVKEPGSIEEMLQQLQQHYVEVANIHFTTSPVHWSWTSYKFQQIKYASLAKRLLGPAMADSVEEIENVRKSFDPKHGKKVKSSSDSGQSEQQLVNDTAPVEKLKSFKTAAPQKDETHVGLENQAAKSKSSENDENSSGVDGSCASNSIKSSSNKVALKKQLQRPWARDIFLFKKLKRKRNSFLQTQVVVAFGNKSRNNCFIRGSYKSSAEKLFCSVAQMTGLENIVDANEYRTSKDCHRCGPLPNVNLKPPHLLAEKINANPRETLGASRKIRKELDYCKKHNLQGPKEIKWDKVSEKQKQRMTLGRKRAPNAILFCETCESTFNRDVNAATNILNIFLSELSN